MRDAKRPVSFPSLFLVANKLPENLMDPNNIDKSKLKERIKNHFNLGELRSLCFDLEIPYEDLSGTTLDAKSRELIEFCERYGRLDNLIEKLQEERPHVDWTVIIILNKQDEPGPSSDSPPQGERNHLPESNDNKQNSKKNEKPKTHIGIIILITIILIVIFSYLVTPQVRKIYFPSVTFCAPDSIVNYSLSAILILVMHIVWHIVSPALDTAATNGTVEFFGLKIPIGPVQSIIDSLHPWKLSEPIFWGTTTIALVVSFIILVAWLPIRHPAASPSLAHFSVDAGLQELPVGVPLQLQSGQTVTIEAVIGELKGSNCTWQSPRNGTFTSINGCEVTYVAPYFSDIDFLEVRIASTCSRYILMSALIVNASNLP